MALLTVREAYFAGAGLPLWLAEIANSSVNFVAQIPLRKFDNTHEKSLSLMDGEPLIFLTQAPPWGKVDGIAKMGL